MFYLKRVITPEHYVNRAKNSNSTNSWSNNNNKYPWHIYQMKGTVLKALMHYQVGTIAIF